MQDPKSFREQTKASTDLTQLSQRLFVQERSHEGGEQTGFPASDRFLASPLSISTIEGGQLLPLDPLVPLPGRPETVTEPPRQQQLLKPEDLEHFTSFDNRKRSRNKRLLVELWAKMENTESDGERLKTYIALASLSRRLLVFESTCRAGKQIGPTSSNRAISPTSSTATVESGPRAPLEPAIPLESDMPSVQLQPIASLQVPPCVIYLNGFPGVGKLAVAKNLLEALPPHSKLVDNHMFIDFVTHFFPIENQRYGVMQSALRKLTFLALKTLTHDHPDMTIVFTGCTTDSIADSEVLNEYINVATDRKVPFVFINLTCDIEEHLKRLESDERKLNPATKMTDPHRLRDIVANNELFPDCEYCNGESWKGFTMSTTVRTAKETAGKIWLTLALK